MQPKQSQGGTTQADRAAQDRARSLIDQVISDRYRIRELIAMGGMGAVYRGEHLLLKKRIAIKILHPETENLPELVKRFEREAIAGAHIQHPNVATATDFGKLPDGSYFLVLEYVKGKTLHQILQDGPLPARRAARLTRQLASALDAIHRLDIVHRDLKPRNIMVVDGPRDLVKIIDLGLAKVKVDELSRTEETRGSAADDDDDHGGLTVAGTIFGTIAYLSPEAAEGMDAVDARSDLYALGLMFYEMLCGKHPFTAVNPVELFMQHRFEPPPAMSARNPDVSVPSSLETIARKLLEKKPENRFQSGAELAAALDEAIVELGPSEDDPSGFVDDDGPMSLDRSEASLRGIAMPSQRPSVPTPSQRPPPSMPSQRPIIPLSLPDPEPDVEPAPEPAARVAPIEETKPSRIETPEPAPLPAPPARKKKSSTSAVITVIVGVALGGVAAFVAREMQHRKTEAAPTPTQVSAKPSAAVVPPRPSAAPTPSAAEVVPAASASAAPEPAASAAVEAPRLSDAEVETEKRKFKDAFRYRDWKNAKEIALALGKSAPQAFEDRSFARLVEGLTIIRSKEKTDDELLQMFADDLGSVGLDALYTFIEGQGRSPIAVAAMKLLEDEARLARATPAMRIALELRTASCVDKLALLDRADKEGDARARVALETLGRACFPLNPNVEKVINDLRMKHPKH